MQDERQSVTSAIVPGVAINLKSLNNEHNYSVMGSVSSFKCMCIGACWSNKLRWHAVQSDVHALEFLVRPTMFSLVAPCRTRHKAQNETLMISTDVPRVAINLKSLNDEHYLVMETVSSFKRLRSGACRSNRLKRQAGQFYFFSLDLGRTNTTTSECSTPRHVPASRHLAFLPHPVH